METQTAYKQGDTLYASKYAQKKDYRYPNKTTKAIIQRIDKERYNSGKPAPNFQINHKKHSEMRLYNFKCNWGSCNKCTERYYHVWAENEYEARELARKTYAHEHHITHEWVVCK